MSLGTNIRRIRAERGWTLERLSELSGVEVGTLSALENRGSVRSKYAPVIARALEVSLEQLYGATPTTSAREPLAPTYLARLAPLLVDNLPEQIEKLISLAKLNAEENKRQWRVLEQKFGTKTVVRDGEVAKQLPLPPIDTEPRRPRAKKTTK